MKWLAGFLVVSMIFLISARAARATYDPNSVPNNKYGIHILDESDLGNAAQLVNGNGGEWGYVTLVIRKDERDNVKWNRVFKKLSELKLIPIVRIATESLPAQAGKSEIWEKPLVEDAGAWATFLSSLDWPTENRYVILFNEPNHSDEWGGEINPAEYSQISRVYWEQLKRKSENFFVLPAAIDEAAGNTKKTMDAIDFFEGMSKGDELVFTLFDGWNSHSYPNPDFSALPSEEGRLGVGGYKWEINYLKRYYLRQDIPVFITETGWDNKLGEDKISDNFMYSFNNVWSDKQVVAVTPFILNYQYPPFDKFSWKNPETGDYYSYYFSVMNVLKISGEPEIPQKPQKKSEVAGVSTTKTYPFLRDYFYNNNRRTFFDFGGLFLE